MKREWGFTLIELMMTVGIASLLLFGGVPALADFVQAAESRSTSLKLVGRFNLARASAINTGRITTLCGSSDGTHCDRGWDKGILIFTDGGEAGVVDADDKIVRYDDPVSKGTLRWRDFKKKPYVQFTNIGRTNYQNGNLTYCPSSRNAEFARKLVVSVTGRVRIAEPGRTKDAPNC